MSRLVVWILGLSLMVPAVSGGPAAAAVSRKAIENAQLKGTVRSAGGVQPAVAKAQILLDRASISPGVIDGAYGDNLKKALRVFQGQKGLPASGVLDRRTWKALVGRGTGAVLTTYTIQKADAAGPFVKSIPSDMKKMAKLKRLAYTSPRELLAEKFHMDQDFLKLLNPKAGFGKAGSRIVVANVRGEGSSRKVASIVVDRKTQAVKAYDPKGKLVAFYPATVGSKQFPSPSGRVKVKSVAENPVFTYSAKLDYSKLKKGQLKIPPGPNNPVGRVWIDLSKAGYGIHGTPEPAKVSKTASHGCVRLTNWDAMELAHYVKAGLPVIFAG